MTLKQLGGIQGKGVDAEWFGTGSDKALALYSVVESIWHLGLQDAWFKTRSEKQ